MRTHPPVRRLVVLAMAVAATAAAPAQTRRPMSIVDTIDMPIAIDPQVSPDGRRVAFVQLKADWKANRLMPHLYAMGIDGDDLHQITFDERGETSPRWSPDGRTLAFSARREGDQVPQIYLLPLEGGEARRLTTHPTPPGSLAWAPDGQSIWFLAAEAPSADERARTAAQDDVYYLDEDWKHRRLWKVDLGGTTTQVLTGDFTVAEFAFSADGAKVVHVRAPSPRPDDAPRQDVWVMNADGSGERRVTDNGVAETGAQLSPDGTRVLFLAEASARLEPYHNARLFVAAASGGPATALQPDAAWEVEAAAWRPDGRTIAYVANLGVHSQLFEVPAAGGAARALTSGDHALGNWRSGAFGDVFVRSEAARAEIWRRAPGPDGALQQLTRLHDYVSRDFLLGRQEKVSWKGRDGVTIEGVLTYPTDYQPGTRYPLVVHTHGGPAQSDKFGAANNPFYYLHAMAGRGYLVLRPNYRGSTGYGDAFMRDVLNGYFNEQQHDVMAGIDHLVQAGLADPSRLAAMGWSAGGHLTNKLVTMTDRFKAAISGAGVGNWASLYAQSDTRTARDLWLGGNPWQRDAPIARLWAASPASEGWKVKTPLLILVGERDARVPMWQSVEMYRAVTYNGGTARLLIAPRAPHSFAELRHVLAQANAGLEWIERYALGRSYTWEAVPGK
ncbi:MAG: S9 family peptidase [Acidobacteriota bacterium]